MSNERSPLYETHSHTPLCRHADGEPVEYAQAAYDRGLSGIVITCHSPMPDRFSWKVRMEPEQFDEYLRIVQHAREEYAGQVDVRVGMESDWFPGMEKWLTELHARTEFHYILGSVHPQIPEYREAYDTGDWPAFHRGYFTHLADAAETGLYDSISHPDLAKNLGSDEYDLEALLPMIRESLDRIAATGVAMELNTSGANKKVPEMNPSPAILSEMNARGIPVVIGADAHVPHRVGDAFETALDLLSKAGYLQCSYFLERERIDINLHDARKGLRRIEPQGIDASQIGFTPPAVMTLPEEAFVIERHSVTVLILCTGNSARSIMGEYLLKTAGKVRFDAHSAGAAPTGKVNPFAVKYLDSIGIGATDGTSKHVDDLSHIDFKLVITVCDNAAETCPIWPKDTAVAHWSFPDPAAVEGTDEEKLAAFTKIGEQLRTRMRLLACLPAEHMSKERLQSSAQAIHDRLQEKVEKVTAA